MIIRTAFCSADLLALTAGAFAHQSQGSTPQAGKPQNQAPAPDGKTLQAPPVTVVTPKEAKKPEPAPKRKPVSEGVAGRAGPSSQQPSGEGTPGGASAAGST